MTTIKDVARRAGVAPSTVSRVLAGSARISVETQERVRAAMKELNYHPNAIASSLARRSTGTIGLIIARPAEQAFANAFFPEVIRGIGTVLQPEGYNLLLSTTANFQEERQACLRLLRQRRVDGVILTSVRSRDRLVGDLLAEDFPFVLIGRGPEGKPVTWVNNDNVAVGAMAVAHLIGQGHRRIALINGPDDLVVCLDRRQGYLNGLAAAGLPGRPEYLREGGFTREGGYRAMGELLDLPEPPTAVFCVDDPTALGALFCLRERGVPCGPGGVALVGVNDDPLAGLITPGLSTVRIPILEMGATAARLLIDRVARPNSLPRQVILPSTLVVRESSNWNLV